jgi:hypothetical protein
MSIFGYFEELFHFYPKFVAFIATGGGFGFVIGLIYFLRTIWHLVKAHHLL